MKASWFNRTAWRTGAGAVLLGLLLPADGAQAADRYWPPIVDPATGQHTPGRFVWGDLVTSDVAAAADFYGKVFGWTFETYGGEQDNDTYTLALADGLPIGGMVYDERARKGKTLAARWIGLISVEDVSQTATAVTQHGGKVVLPPVMLGERGETAVFADAEGVLFGVVKSKNGDPPDFAGDLNEWAWIDLWSNDVEKAATFYRAALGYETVPVTREGLSDGVHLVAGGVLRAGIMQKSNTRTSSTWLPYLRVADVSAATARARAAGGRVVLEPTSVGENDVAIVADPTGAPVGIVRIPSREVQP
jgi:predicted enzyme related to lactoylglutathione lyase